jgi:hypothetical protein
MLKRVWSKVGLVVALLLIFPGTSQAASEDMECLDAVGGLCGSYIYITYAYIGMTADAFSKKMYQPEQVKEMMDETVIMLNKLMKILGRVQTTDIAEEDKKFIVSLIEVLSLLRTEAEHLSAYAESNDMADVEKYDEARRTVLPKIKQLLQLQ